MQQQKTNLPPLAVALSVVGELAFNELVDFSQSHAVLSGAADCHSDQLHVGIWWTFLQSVTLTSTTNTHKTVITAKYTI